MAILEQLDTGTRCVLFSRHLVGRSRDAHLRLRESNISGEHATIRWNGRSWEILDLASRNGTTVNGRRLTPGERTVLARGAILGFGNQGNRWRLIDDAPPSAMAVPTDGSAPRPAADDLLALPDDDQPDVAVYRNRAGDWVLERSGGDTTAVTHGSEVVAGGQRFTLHLPEIAIATSDGDLLPPHIHDVALRFSVTRDEEHVELTALTPRGTIELGARAHFYVLLTLARARLADQQRVAEGGDADERVHGWIYQDDLCDMLHIDLKHLNVAVYRCRRQLVAAGIAGAADVVERRNSTRQLRLGVGRIEIDTI